MAVEEPGEAFYRKYLGGSALGMHYALKLTPKGADPLGPENAMIVSVGVTTGAAISGQSRVTVTAKSPLTGAIGDAQAGGFWPAEAKWSGFDAFVITGRSDKPVYLWVHDGEFELRDASHIWGKVTGDAEAAIREELGDSKIEVLQIGPGGERGVLYACVINMSNRANGRTGMGTVMGSKNLKAIAVRGKNRTQIADKNALGVLAKWGAETMPKSPAQGFGQLGTPGVLGGQHKSGGLPTCNWKSGVFEGYETITGQAMADTILKEQDTCFGCIIRCKRVVETDWKDKKVEPLYGGPEYETLATFGSYCGVNDLKAISYANQLCNMYGLDTIACGATIAFAMECFERGLISEKDTGGLDLRFGNADAMVQVVEQIAKKEGFGETLAYGSDEAAKRIGKGSEALSVTVKHHALPAHMPQVKRSLGLIYAVNPFGADHVSSEHDPFYESLYPAFKERMVSLDLLDPQEPYTLEEGKVRFAVSTEHWYSMMDSVSCCQFVYGSAWQLYGPDHLVDMVKAVTGWDVSLQELLKVGERRLNMMRAFNAREGFTRDHDVLPSRLSEPLKGGPSDGMFMSKEELEKAKDIYYAMCGWEANGTPTRAKLEELNLGWVADEIGV
jgi:aldehyde:ferredoxin oxidoreductase